jgi:phosphotransferase system enzyme I (PtsP)
MTKLEEENPALGWRAIRIGLDRPGLLRLQLRAMLKAGAGRQLRIMFPMVAATSEFLAARELVEREVAFLRGHGYELPAQLQLGVMVEVPSLLWQLDELCPLVDFLSVGSNDLMQYLFAVDRDNKRVAKRYDSLSAPFLRALQLIADTAARHGKPVTLCGEMGGRTAEALVLAAIGYRGLSMAPSSIGPVKAAILATELGPFRDYVLDRVTDGLESEAIRADIRAFADKHRIPL